MSSRVDRATSSPADRESCGDLPAVPSSVSARAHRRATTKVGSWSRPADVSENESTGSFRRVSADTKRLTSRLALDFSCRHPAPWLAPDRPGGLPNVRRCLPSSIAHRRGTTLSCHTAPKCWLRDLDDRCRSNHPPLRVAPCPTRLRPAICPPGRCETRRPTGRSGVHIWRRARTVMTTLSYRHQGGDTALLGETIYPYLRRIADRSPDNEAVVSREQGIRWTYREFFDEIDRMARGLLALRRRAGRPRRHLGDQQRRVDAAADRHRPRSARCWSTSIRPTAPPSSSTRCARRACRPSS